MELSDHTRATLTNKKRVGVELEDLTGGLRMYIMFFLQSACAECTCIVDFSPATISVHTASRRCPRFEIGMVDATQTSNYPSHHVPNIFLRQICQTARTTGQTRCANVC